MAIFVRPMRYKGCHRAHNAQVVMCALFTTRNSLKLQGRRKVVFTHSQSSCHIAKVVLTLRHDSRQIPIASDAQPLHTSRGFLLWRFAYAGPGVRRATIMGPASANLHNNGLMHRSKQRGQLCGLYHSITSSARASSIAGIVMPSALAVVRFTTRSNLVGCSTGTSAGREPRRTLSTSSAARRNRSGKFAP